MSLNSFVNQNINMIKELIIEESNITKISFKDIYLYYRKNEKRYPIESYINILFYDSICKCSENIIEYRLLYKRLEAISQISQSLINMNIGEMNI